MSEPFKCHSKKQEQLIFSDARETYAITGIQWAKTTSGAWWLKRHMFLNTDPDDAFIVAAPNYKIMNQSTLPAFKKVMDGFGEYKAGPAEFHMHGGGICYMRTGTEPDSVVGITNVKAVWGDEAGKFSLYFWENLLTRASFKEAPCMFTSTPYAMNWLHKSVLKPFKSGLRKDILVIQAKSCDNPFFPMSEYLKKKETMDPRRFNAMYNGEFEKMHGRVYDCFDDDLNICKPFSLPFGTKYYAGVDWGTTHPFVIAPRGITPDGNHFRVSEYYKTGLTIMDMIQVAKKFKQVWGIEVFYCDPAQPGYIEEFNRHGLTAVPANNDIRPGIDLHYSLIKERKFQVFEGAAPHSLDEYDSYHYPEPDDLGPDDKDKEQLPVDQDNHAMDADRYCTIMTYHAQGEKLTPKQNELGKKTETIDQRIKRLKSTNRFKKAENWS